MLFKFLCAICCIALSLGAGFTTHNSAARRTSQFEYFGPKSSTFDPSFFNGLALERLDAVQGGAPFPDYLYTCGDDHDAGESAHWSPFQIAGADYIRSAYPNWAAESRQGPGAGLVAFMFGVTSHYIVDMNWHGLETVPSGEGIIRTMGFADFNCTNGDLCSIAHSAADTGGEFAAAKLLDVHWHPQGKWYIPYSDLVKVYASMNITVQESWIKECAVIFYAGSFAVSRLGDIIYDVIMAPRVGSLLLEEYIDFPVGGLDDDAAWTGFMWNRFADWVINGTPDVPPNFQNEVTVDMRRLLQDNLQKKFSSKKRFSAKIREALTAYGAFPLEDGKSKGLFRVEDVSYDQTQAAFIDMQLEESNIEKDRELLHAIGDALISDYALDILGEFKSQLKQEELSALQESVYHRIDAYLSKTSHVKDSNKTNEEKKIPVNVEVAHGSDPHEYFGSSITVADFSGRGNGEKCDILVGSYGAGRMGGPQEGRAKIIFGAACDIAIAATLTNGSSTNPLKLPSNFASSSFSFRGGMMHGDPVPSYERFGYSSAAMDCNGDKYVDVIICAPSFGGRNVSQVVGNYSGRCDIFLGPFNSHDNIDLPFPSASIYGDAMWGLFGTALKVGDINGDGKDDLIVGAPGAGSYSDIAPNARGDVSSQGSVHVFLSQTISNLFSRPNKDFTAVSASKLSDFTLQHAPSFQYFGKSLEIVEGSNPLLIIGAPFYQFETAENANSAGGRVFAYSFTNKSMVTAKDFEWSIMGCNHAGRMGQTVAYSPKLDLLAIAEPSFNVSSKVLDKFSRKGLRAGRVVLIPMKDLQSYVAANGRELTMFDVQDWESVKVIDGDETDARFGFQLQFKSASLPVDLSADQLIASSPLSTTGGTISGYQISQLDSKLHVLKSWSVSGNDVGATRGHLGYRMHSLHTLLPTSSQIVMASAPLADCGGVAPDGDQLGSLFAFVVPVMV